MPQHKPLKRFQQKAEKMKKSSQPLHSAAKIVQEAAKKKLSKHAKLKEIFDFFDMSDSTRKEESTINTASILNAYFG